MWFDFYLNLFGERGGRRNLKLSWCNYTHRLGFQKGQLKICSIIVIDCSFQLFFSLQLTFSIAFDVL